MDCYKCESPVSLCICDESITDEYEYHAWCKGRVAKLEAENQRVRQVIKFWYDEGYNRIQAGKLLEGK